MSRIRSRTLAIWLLEHLALGLTRESISGDLLEQTASGGRSAAWMWRQVVIAIAAGWASRLRDFLPPLLFCALWVSLYPGWNLLARRILANATPEEWNQLAWPWSALLPLSYGLLPAITFVWVGFRVYLLARPGMLHELPLQRLLWGLSASLNVLLVFSIALLHHFRQSRVDLRTLARADFFSAFHLLWFSIPVALSLFAALCPTVTGTPRVARRRRLPPIESAGKASHFQPHGSAVRGNESVTSLRPIRVGLSVFLLLCVAGQLRSQASPAGAPPAVQLVAVDKDIKLEVLDWGGTGRPLLFLAGLGNDAHVFDQFAPHFTPHYRVFGITRRGFGASSRPVPDGENYSADRLGDDVLAVMSALRIERPILVGHSIAGQELSSIGARYPEKVAGLIYLDAGYGYAFYDQLHGETIFDFFQLKKQLDDFTSGAAPSTGESMGEMSADAEAFARDIKEAMERDPSVPELHRPSAPLPPIALAINLEGRKYSTIPVPILAIYACPHSFDFDPALRSDPALKKRVVGEDTFVTSRQADAFAAGVPSAHVVRLANADHYVFRSNQADVIREMNAFLDHLP